MSRTKTSRPALKWTGVLFAVAANMLLVTVTNGLVQSLHLPTEYETLATIVAPILAGVLTALYVPHRGGMHALLGGSLSFFPLWWFIFNGVWQLALFAAAFCTFGGAITEVLLRSRQK